MHRYDVNYALFVKLKFHDPWVRGLSPGMGLSDLVKAIKSCTVFVLYPLTHLKKSK